MFARRDAQYAAEVMKGRIVEQKTCTTVNCSALHWCNAWLFVSQCRCVNPRLDAHPPFSLYFTKEVGKYYVPRIISVLRHAIFSTGPFRYISGFCSVFTENITVRSPNSTSTYLPFMDATKTPRTLKFLSTCIILFL